MTDIAERLRSEIDHDVNEPLDRLLDEAADEIGRLREALRDISLFALGHDDWENALLQARHEREAGARYRPA
jgi:hypothetical protein